MASDFPHAESLPLRVTQLDAGELDNEIVDILRNKFLSIFKHFQSFCVEKYYPEVTAIIQFILWKFSLCNHNATFGQSMVDTRYKDAAMSAAVGTLPSTIQKRLYAASVILVPLIIERLPSAASLVLAPGHYQKFCWALRQLEQLWSAACLVNFLVFLYNGKFLHLIERLLRLQTIHPQRQLLRQISFDFTTREILWNGFGELLMFVLPMVNLKQLWRTIMAKPAFSGHNGQSAGAVPDDAVTARRACALCRDIPPTNAHQFDGCRHVYCYCCLEGKFKDEGKVHCAICSCTLTAAGHMTAASVAGAMTSLWNRRGGVRIN